MSALSPPLPTHLSNFYSIINFRTCSSMAGEKSVGIHSEGCQDTLPTWAAGASRGVRTRIPATGISASVAGSFMIRTLNKISPELQISAIWVLQYLPGVLGGNKDKNIPCLWYTQSSFALMFFGHYFGFKGQPC